MAQLYVETETLPLSGTFASFFKQLTLQNSGVIVSHIGGQNFTGVELNGNLVNATFVRGAMLVKEATGKVICPMEMTRVSGIENCNSILFQTRIL